uniref:Secreted protein n=1 Tax=Ixodes ricinus TaxID=34613 RepID=A0A6B0UY77_IXORI
MVGPFLGSNIALGMEWLLLLGSPATTGPAKRHCPTLRRSTKIQTPPWWDLFVAPISSSESSGLFLESPISGSAHPFTPPNPVAIFKAENVRALTSSADVTGSQQKVADGTGVFLVVVLLFLASPPQRAVFRALSTRTDLDLTLKKTQSFLLGDGSVLARFSRTN